jgi:hypothetical protein
MLEPLQSLKKKYDDMFQEPKTLPPVRAFDHAIPKGEEPVKSSFALYYQRRNRIYTSKCDTKHHFSTSE